MNAAIPVEMLRADAPAVFLGMLIFIAGAVSCLLFALRARQRDTALLYFGISASMYGLRLIATTGLVRHAFPDASGVWNWIIWVVNFTIFIPFTLFFVNTVAPQWKRASRWIISIATGEALFGIAAYATGAGRAARLAYSIEVIVYLPLLALMLFLPPRPAERERSSSVCSPTRTSLCPGWRSPPNTRPHRQLQAISIIS